MVGPPSGSYKKEISVASCQFFKVKTENIYIYIYTLFFSENNARNIGITKERTHGILLCHSKRQKRVGGAQQAIRHMLILALLATLRAQPFRYYVSLPYCLTPPPPTCSISANTVTTDCTDRHRNGAAKSMSIKGSQAAGGICRERGLSRDLRGSWFSRCSRYT